LTGILRRARWAAPLLLLAASAAVSRGVLLDRSPSRSDAVDPDAPFLLGEMSRHPAFAFGFRNFLSDIVWLEAVQVSGNKKMLPAHYDRLAVLLDAVANFDPKVRVAYLLGGLVLGESAPHAHAAIRVLERGRDNFPDDWRFPFYIGYTRYFVLGEAAEGGQWMMKASRLKNSPEYLPRLAARMLAEGREPETALSFLKVMIAQESDPSRKEILVRRAVEVAIERDLQAIERAAAAFRSAKGTWPGGMSDLVAGGFLSRVPTHPSGGGYRLKSDGTAFSTTGEARLRTFRGNK
jgi:hypothetical protein